jgi:hypothetical protein
MSFKSYLNESLDTTKLKQLSTSNPDAATATLAVLKAILTNPKINKSTLINKIAAEQGTSAAKINSIIIAMGISLDPVTEEAKPKDVNSGSAKDEIKITDKDVKANALDDKGKEPVKTESAISEDWIPMSRTKADKVVKVKTKKSGNNYFYVVSSDLKDKEFYVVTPKQYNDDNTDKTMTVSFADVVMVSTDDMPEDNEKGGNQKSKVTIHKSRQSAADDEDEDDKKSKTRSASKAVKDMEVDD